MFELGVVENMWQKVVISMRNPNTNLHLHGIIFTKIRKIK